MFMVIVLDFVKLDYVILFGVKLVLTVNIVTIAKVFLRNDLCKIKQSVLRNNQWRKSFESFLGSISFRFYFL